MNPWLEIIFLLHQYLVAKIILFISYLLWYVLMLEDTVGMS
jgi:hypothetical protein